jgi:pSer/pThr/pTyr-binding forkhead associated (FHA) protein
MSQIEVITAEGRRKIELGGSPVTIGRSKVCQCRVNDKALSREHMEFRKKPDGFWVRDMGSRNKTFVNGLKVEAEMQLKAGDRITAGRTLILFDATPEQSAAAKPVGATPAKPEAPASSSPGGGWAPASPTPAKAAAEGTAPIQQLAGEAAAAPSDGSAGPAWKKQLMFAVILGGAVLAGLFVYLLFFG